MSALKIIPFHVPLLISNSQLKWTWHAKQRLSERGVTLPASKVVKWELIEESYSDGKPCLVIRHALSSMLDVVLVVSREIKGYSVISCWVE